MDQSIIDIAHKPHYINREYTMSTEKKWLYMPGNIIDSALVTSVQIDGGEVSEYEYTESDKLHDYPVRLLIGGHEPGFLLGIGANPLKPFVSISYYGDDIFAALSAIEECGLYSKDRVDDLRDKAGQLNSRYDEQMARIVEKRKTKAQPKIQPENTGTPTEH